MVIDENFDRALWLILYRDKICRNDIANLIYNIPSEIFYKIHQQIEKYNRDEYDIDADFDFSKFRKAIRTSDKETLIYDVEMNPDEVKIKLTKLIENIDRLEEYFELTLFPISKERLGSEYYIDVGEYYHKNSRIIPILDTFVSTSFGNDREYSLENNSFFGLVMRTNQDSHYFKRVNLDKISSLIDMDDLKDNQSVNRLIRGKRKR